MFEYKGTVSGSIAYEVELATSNSDNYVHWTSFDGQHIAVGENGLFQEIHDASMHGVDALISGVAGCWSKTQQRATPQHRSPPTNSRFIDVLVQDNN